MYNKSILNEYVLYKSDYVCATINQQANNVVLIHKQQTINKNTIYFIINMKNTKTHIELLNEQLVSIAINVAYSDKANLFASKSISIFTINQYLRGEGRNIDTAETILLFLRNEIELRAKRLTKKVATA